MRRLIFNLIAAYVRNTPPHPGRGILARWAWKLYPHEIVTEIAPSIKILVRLCSVDDITCWRGEHEKHSETKVFLSHLREGMTVMDIGANVGLYALYFARKVGTTGKVYAFEPVPENFERLKEHIILNNANNILPVPLALADQKGKAGMSVAGVRSSLFYHVTDQFVEVPMTTLDDFIAEQGVERVDAIKLDVEGAELQVIRGADQTIRKFNPIMMVEINTTTLRAAGTSPEELFQAIVSYGYKAFVIRNGKAIPTNEVVRPMGYHGWVIADNSLRRIRFEFDNYLFLPQGA